MSQSAPLSRPPRFAALKNPHCAVYLGGGATSMMADNIEHVITYWVLWEVFESPALLAFQVISHWLPFLLGSVHAGALADRYDCRRVIQVAQILFMLVSLGWGLLLWTDSLSIPMACLLLVLHGMAGALWAPAEQLMLEDFVGREELESAVRLNATARNLGVLFGPVVGSFLMLRFGPTTAMFLNILIYLPLTLYLLKTPYTGHTRERNVPKVRLTFKGAYEVIQETSQHPILMPMVILGGLGSFFIGASLQTVMPAFANSFGLEEGQSAYSTLLFAVGAGGVVGGIALEFFRFLKPTVRAAILSTLFYGLSIFIFSLTSNYHLAILVLFVSGVANLASMSISQTVVQLEAPPDKRGQMIGVYNMAANGLRIGSAFTVGMMAGFIGVHWAMAGSALTLVLATVYLAERIKKRRHLREATL